MALERLTQNLNQMADRARDFSPASERVHDHLLGWQRTIDVGPEKNRLDPSLQDPGHPEHVWEVDANAFTFGTRVPYSVYYAAHRMDTGQTSHMKLPRRVLRDIAQTLGRYLLTGDAF